MSHYKQVVQLTDVLDKLLRVVIMKCRESDHCVLLGEMVAVVEHLCILEEGIQVRV